MWMRIGHINQGPFHWHDEPNRDAACGAEWPLERAMPDARHPEAEWQPFRAECIITGLAHRVIVAPSEACPACVAGMSAAARAYAVREGFEAAVR